MNRMIARPIAWRTLCRAVGVKVVMGGPHVTEMADEALGRDGGSRHADAVALGEADETWPRMWKMPCAHAQGCLRAVDDFGQERKPSLQSYPEIPWDKIKLDQFNLLPAYCIHCSSEWALVGEPFELFPWSPGAAVLTDASFAP